MADVALLKRRMRKAVARERDAMTRLRRAQTLYDKAYETRQRLTERLFEIEDEVERLTNRMIGGDNATK